MTVEVVLPADREAWLAARMQDVTASVAGTLLGVHPYITPYQLWAQKTGRVVEDGDETAAQKRGRLFEPVAIELLREERPEWTVDYRQDRMYLRDPAARLGATPDAFAHRPDIGGRGIVQIKTASGFAFRDTWRDPDTREIVLPLWIACQAIIEADLAEATWAAVAVMVLDRGVDLFVIDVPVHAGIRRRVREAVSEFWALVESGGEPPIDWHRDGKTVIDVYRQSIDHELDLTGDAELDELIANYERLGAESRAADKEREAIKPQIFRLLGNASTALTDSFEIIAKTQKRKAYTVAESESRPLRIKPRVRHAENIG